MNIHNHLQNITELEENAVIYTGYDYTKNDPHGLADDFFQFCQESLATSEWEIQPAKFLFIAEASVNAWAAKRYGYYVIGIHMGTMTTLHRFFTDRTELFNNPILAEFEPLRGKLNVSLDMLMYQVATLFTFYHELGHLIQYSPVDSTTKGKDIEKIEEAYAVGAGRDDPYDLVRHVKEFDADLHGAFYICIHQLDYWKRLKEEDKTQANLELMISIGAGAIFTYFVFLLRNYTEMYYEASNHPHPLVRILYIIDMFIKTAQNNLPEGLTIKPENILNRAFRLTQAMFTFNNGEDRVKKFADLFQSEKDKIDAYVNDILIPESRKMPALILERNRIKRTTII